MRTVVAVAVAWVLVWTLISAPAVAEDRYLAWLKEARASHAWWAGYFRANPAGRDRTITLVECVGDVAHQERWIQRYDELIKRYTRR